MASGASAPLCLLETLPPSWTALLPPRCFSQLQAASAALRAPAAAAEDYWAEQCASRLGCSANQVSLLAPAAPPEAPSPAAPPPEASPAVGGGAPPAQPRPWRAAYLALDLRTLGNELVHTQRQYASLFLGREDEARWGREDASSDDEREDQYQRLPAGVVFDHDDQGRCLRCRLSGPLGDDRCVVACEPLRRQGAVTAVAASPAPGSSPELWRWTLGLREGGYYEVTIGDIVAIEEETSWYRQCVSVGLATSGLTARSVHEQQAGWNIDSWALHGDDGMLFHGSGSSGRPFRPLPMVVRGGAVVEAPAAGFPCVAPPIFGAGDVVGCGYVHFAVFFGIFFALNGQFLGLAVIVRNDPEVELKPCCGLDAHWPLTFNFGDRPFMFDPDEVLASRG